MPARQHGHFLPRWLVAILPFWASSGTPGKQSVPPGLTGSAQPDGEHPGPRPATCSGGLLSHGGLVTGVIDLGQQKATFHQEKAVWQLQSRVAWLFLSKRKNAVGEKKLPVSIYMLKKNNLFAGELGKEPNRHIQ